MPWTSTDKELDGKHALGGTVVGVAVGVGLLLFLVVEQDAQGSHPVVFSDAHATASNKQTANPTQRKVIVDLLDAFSRLAGDMALLNPNPHQKVLQNVAANIDKCDASSKRIRRMADR